MTNKEAAYILSDKCCDYSCEELRTAFDLAIKALEERPQGEWIKDEDTGLIGCSHCHIVWLRGITAFCPNCGADMRGNDNG